MKGIVLAGGAGTRLYPTTLAISKQLLPVYDKPMIYYPISVLMLAGIKDILIISTPNDMPLFKKLLGDGSRFGVNFSYIVQAQPNGIAQAFILGREFIGDDDVALILGDNIFYGAGFSGILQKASETVSREGGAVIFCYPVKDAKRFGVVEFDEQKNILSISEKPENPKSNYAVTGLYFYDNKVVDYVKELKPSYRNELEITDLNNVYLKLGTLKPEIFGRGFSWLDTGTCESMFQAGQYIKAVEENQGIKIACLEEIAYNSGFISKSCILNQIVDVKDNVYYEYIKGVIGE